MEFLLCVKVFSGRGDRWLGQWDACILHPEFRCVFGVMALFHCMVRYGSARLGMVQYGSVRVGLRFHRSLVPL